MKRYILLITAIFTFSISASATYSDADCRQLFQNAYDELVGYVDDFNSGYMDDQDFVMRVGLLSTEVAANKFVCHLVATKESLSCLSAYEERYSALRNEIRLGAVIAGNQTRIEQSVMEKIRGDFSHLVTRLKCQGL
ncbi:hypothetical protein HBN50_08990 [Halobacteriovorax sp. GB3]|uniref:hypothetical protein n=1 Tax=Halobacteriovorax sp. GB3 TaxID=2719615 RepID=UPI0023602261|nr:hypothetical protein [Halobacteriovorax sp. GB3]MDD0853232.1 hypothetical protein [Halobacteriovorax sp. GB3]